MKIWVLVVVGVLAGWAFLVFGYLLAPVPLLAACLGISLFVCGHRAALAVLIGASPVGFATAWAVASYALGTGHLWTMGYPHA